VNELTSKGYKKGKSLFGAPYDFRYAPGPRASKVAVEYQKDLKSLIEHAYTTNNKEPVVLVSHSMGCLWTLYFLNQQPMEWRHKFVAHFVTIAAPWGGVVEQMMTFASGNPEGVPFVNPLVIRKEQRSSESNLWLLPEVLQAPKVPITLIYGFGVPTAETLNYDSKGFDYIPKIEMGDGDGTVNVCSLTAVISDWKNTQGQSLDVIAFPEKGHMKILQDKEALEVIVNTILNARPQQQLVV
jgi:lysophospholipase-3